ncbi:cysteine proteinase [Camillea tinctor]|nr:cysteine proteinase [Camillea tinctor]
MFFNIVADSIEQNSDLASQAVGVAHRTQNGIFDAIGVNKILPNAIKDLNDKVYDANETLVRDSGHATATWFRGIGGSSQQPQDEEPDKLPGAYNTGVGPHPSRPHPSQPDPRDHIYQPTDKPVSHHVDLRNHCPEVYDQGHMGSCTANAVAGAFEFNVRKQGLPEFSPSRLFIWYNARAKGAPGDTQKNVGSNLKDAIRSLDLRVHGVCSEKDWPYEVAPSDEKTHKFYPGARAAMKPPKRVEDHAHKHTAPKYKKFPDHSVKTFTQCLNSGFPVVFGMCTYGLLGGQPIRSTGRGLKHPTPHEMKNEHRHSLLAVGYIEAEKVLIVRNSWGAHWGENGYFYMPYSFLKYCYEAWSISLVHSPPETS